MNPGRDIDSGLRLADLNFQGYPQVIAAYILSRDGEVGLVETGPTRTLDVLLDALEPFGGVKALTSVAVTHVHLDHCGAVGKLLQMAPGVRCYVHSQGARHLVDPSRLLRSASRIYGDDMHRLWGEVVPVPENRIAAVDDGDVIRIGGQDLRVLYTPGHASHHMALLDVRRNAVFTGDVAGVRLPGLHHVRTPTPPPDIDLDLWRSSIDRLRELRVQSLYMTHFGSHQAGLDHQLEEVLVRLDLWAKMIREGMERGDDPAVMAEMLREEGDEDVRSEGGDDTSVRQYDLASPYDMSVDGLIRFIKTHERLEA